MRDFYIRIENGTSVSTFDIYWDFINPSYYATIYGTTVSATGISFLQITTNPGILVEVPDGATSIILNSSQPTFCPGVGSSSMIYSYNLPPITTTTAAPLAPMAPVVPPTTTTTTTTTTAPIILDTTPPNNSGATVSFVGSTTNSLTGSWSGFTDNIAVDHYVVRVSVVSSGFVAYTSTNLSSSTVNHTATGLTQNTQYYYTVYAYDSAGNSSIVFFTSVTPATTTAGPSIVFSNYSSLSASPFNGNSTDQTVSGTISVTGATFRVRSSATIYTNNSTTVSTNLTIDGNGLYIQQSNSSGTSLSSGYLDLIPGNHTYTLHVIGSGLGGSGSGGVDITQL